MASSRGHSVPVVNGHEQAEGAEHAASVVSHDHGPDEDNLTIEMGAAYPAEAGLASLQRSVSLDRRTAGGRVLLEDRFAFATGAGEFQSVLVTPLAAEGDNGVVRIGDMQAGMRVDYDAQALAVSFDRHERVEKQYQPAVDLIRVVFTPRQKAREGRIALAISPLA